MCPAVAVAWVSNGGQRCGALVPANSAGSGTVSLFGAVLPLPPFGLGKRKVRGRLPQRRRSLRVHMLRNGRRGP